MFSNIFLFVLFSCITWTNERGYIKYTFEKNTFNNFILPVCISKRYKCYPFVLSTSIKEVLVLDGNNYMNGYLAEKSKTFKKSNELVSNYFHSYYYKGKYGTDTFFVEETDIHIKDFKFILVSDGIYMDNFNGILGLGNDYVDFGTELNFIQSLVNNGNIDKPVFTIGNNTIVFGPNNDTYPSENIKKPYTCKIRNKGKLSELLTCDINSVLITGEDILYIDSNPRLLKIDIEHVGISCPKSFFLYLQEKFFGPYIEKETCKVFENTVFPCYIQCEEDVIQSLSEIEIIFFIDKWNIKYTVGELFKDKKFLITYIKGEEDWGFGHIIRENFLMTVDKKDDLIYFIKR